MTDEQNQIPDQPTGEVPVNETPVNDAEPEQQDNVNDMNGNQDEYSERLERLGGEPAPVITPEEFARLQRAGQVHIDARGRVRTARRSDAEAGVSLRKRRAWYG